MTRPHYRDALQKRTTKTHDRDTSQNERNEEDTGLAGREPGSTRTPACGLIVGRMRHRTAPDQHFSKGGISSRGALPFHNTLNILETIGPPAEPHRSQTGPQAVTDRSTSGLPVSLHPGDNEVYERPCVNRA